MESIGIYSPISGITTNQSECFNTLLKRYEQWREAPLDSMILGLYFLQIYYHNEIQRGYGGIGSYSLLSEYGFAAIPLDEIMTLTALSPEEIVDKIRNDQVWHSSIGFSSTEEINHAEESSDFKSTEELHGFNAAQPAESSDSKVTEEVDKSHASCSSDCKSTEEVYACSSDPKSTGELLESHAPQPSDSKSTEEVYEPANTTQYARAR